MRRIQVTATYAVFLLSGLLVVHAKTVPAQVAAPQPQATQVAPMEIKWYSYDDGLAKAKKENKHILIDFYTDWCGWCKKMDASTFRDKALVDYLSKNMVAVKVNAESSKLVTHGDQQLTERILARDVYGARGFPTYFFLTPQGKALFKIPGYQKAEDFINLVEYIGESHYEKSSFATFLESKKNGKGPTRQ